MWWIRTDRCGMFSSLLTVLLILYSQYVIVKVVLLPWYGWHAHLFFYTLCSLLALYSHTKAQFTDPGAVPRQKIPPSLPQPDSNSNLPLEERPLAPRICKRCKTVKPRTAHHCSTCARCIVRMDHHCPWVNNCVAIFNQKSEQNIRDPALYCPYPPHHHQQQYFVLFLFYTCLCCIYAGTLLVARFISCTNNFRTCSITPLQTVLCVLNFVEAIIFGLFVLIMMFDQLTAIFDNTPGIDALQNKHGVKKGRYQSMIDVFGETFSWRWFLPIQLPQKIMLDFEWEVQNQDDPHQHYHDHDHYSPPGWNQTQSSPNYITDTQRLSSAPTNSYHEEEDDHQNHSYEQNHPHPPPHHHHHVHTTDTAVASSSSRSSSSSSFTSFPSQTLAAVLANQSSLQPLPSLVSDHQHNNTNNNTPINYTNRHHTMTTYSHHEDREDVHDDDDDNDNDNDADDEDTEDDEMNSMTELHSFINNRNPAHPHPSHTVR